jgi:hypothetical protein
MKKGELITQTKRVPEGQPVRTVLPNNITERMTPGYSFMYDKVQEYKNR